MMRRLKNLSHHHHLMILVTAAAVALLCKAEDDPCRTSGRCGAFEVCSSRGSPVCSCLRGFYNSSSIGGCVRRVPLDCEGKREDGFLRLQILTLSTHSDLWFGPQAECEPRCLTNCSCLAYGFYGAAGCRFYTDPLIDILEFSTGTGSNIFIRVSISELGKKKDSKKIVVIAVVVGIVVVFGCIYCYWKWIGDRRGKNERVEVEVVDHRSILEEELCDEDNVEKLPLFKFEMLATATNAFSQANKIGRGGFGPVYKGELADGREIAVKMLSQESRQGKKEFVNEVVLISNLQHRNLVRLLGCCVQNNHTMLVYEYMPNKSLDFFLFDPSQDILDWDKRFKIIRGICRGLIYLHRDSRLKIIHRDLKPSNILLDHDWNPKISDFGMARIFGTKQDHIHTARVVGTYGYMAPEYALEGRFSEKSDVFSFGVVMLEIATGTRNVSFHEEGSLSLLGHVWKMWNQGSIASLIDTRISGEEQRAEAARCVHIGLLCVEELPVDRPSVSAVLSMLSSEIVRLPVPKQPAFIIKSSFINNGTNYSHKSRDPNSYVNSISNTMVYGR